MQIGQLGDLLAVVGLEEVDRLLADDPGDEPRAGEHLDALADEDLRVPPADGAEPQQPLVVDVGDDQADLVDVGDDGEQRTVARPGDRRDARAHDVADHAGREALGRRPPDGGGRGLRARRAGGGEQVVQERG